MADTTFFWHDYETFGRTPRRDAPAQFAGIRTDAELNEIGAPLMVYCQPPRDRLPDPESVLLTGILPQQADAEGLPEHAFAGAIEDALGAPGTIGVGYNSIRFDDEVTRHLLWRNLRDPYAREWSNGCGRWDLMDVVRTCWSLRPEGLVWPKYLQGELKGRPSFRLEDLSRANGLLHEAAHDALSDVRATIALARLIRQAQPRLWDFCLKLHKKEAVWAEIGMGRPFVHLSSRYPVERGCLAVVFPLGPHPTNKNELIVWDLAEDPRRLEGLDADTIRRLMFTRQDQLPDGEQRLPIKTIHVNKSPIVIGNLKVVQPVAQTWSLNVEQALAHAEHAPAVAAALQGRWPQVFQRPAGEDGTADVDEDLYGGFVPKEDRRALDNLLRLSPEALAEKVHGGRVPFHDGRLDELLFRYRARNFPATLNADEAARWLAHRQERLIEGQGGEVTLQAYLERIDTLAEAAMERDDERAQNLLEALVDWGEQLAPEA